MIGTIYSVVRNPHWRHAHIDGLPRDGITPDLLG